MGMAVFRLKLHLAGRIDSFLPGTLIWQGSITSEIFNAWIESSVLPHCIPSYTILVLDNALIHKSQVRK